MNRVGIVVGSAALAAVSVVVARKVRKALREMENAPSVTLEQEIEQEFVVEDTGWAPDFANNALDRLVVGTPELARYHVRVVWMSRTLAFTLPGRALYLSRALMDRPGFNEAHAAFVVAHEGAHHVLAHVGDAQGSTTSLIGARLSHLVMGAKNELAADAYAMRACLRAGYDRDVVLGVFDILAHYAEDYGHIDALLPDDDPRSIFEKLSGHPTIQARVAALEDVTIDDDITLDAETSDDVDGSSAT